MKLTRAGAIYIALTLFLGFAAVNTGNNLLYLMVSALLGFMAISGLMGQRNLKGLKVTILPGTDIFAKLPARIDIQVGNPHAYLPAFLIEISIAGQSRLFPLLPPGEGQRLSLSAVLPSRGHHKLTNIWVKSRFPINFFIRSSKLPDTDNILVYPQPQAVIAPEGSQQIKRNQQIAVQQPGQDGELRNIDNYFFSDPLKDIHWKHTARHDEFKVKRYQRLSAPSITLKLDDFNGSVEDQISQCTFMIDHLLRINHAVGLKLGKQLIAPQTGNKHRNTLLKELALYGDN